MYQTKALFSKKGRQALADKVQGLFEDNPLMKLIHYSEGYDAATSSHTAMVIYENKYKGDEKQVALEKLLGAKIKVSEDVPKDEIWISSISQAKVMKTILKLKK